MTLSKILENFFISTAWKMEKPQAYGAFHLIFFAVGLALSIFLAIKLRGLGEKGSRRLIVGLGIFLILTEVYKQLFYYYVVDGIGYHWWIFPFQLCGIPMYICVIAPFLKSQKLKTALYTFLMTYNLLGGFISFLEPSGLCHEYVTLTLHAFVWHMALVFLGLYVALSGKGGKSVADFKRAILVFFSLCVIAFAINLTVKGITSEDINMFYIGPQNSPLAVFKDISRIFGWYVNTLIYIPVLTLGAYIFYLPTYLYNKRKKRSEQ